jgi:hypothetical protein
LLGLIVGFGLGHFVARDRNGFILFLVVDIAIIVVASVLQFAIFHGFWFGYLGLLISHVIQGIDAYAQAGGERILERTRQSAVRIATAAPAPGRDEPAITTRVLSWAF